MEKRRKKKKETSLSYFPNNRIRTNRKRKFFVISGIKRDKFEISQKAFPSDHVIFYQIKTFFCRKKNAHFFSSCGYHLLYFDQINLLPN